MDDIVERMRRALDPFWYHTRNDLIVEAMGEISRLRAERDDWRGVAECNDAFLQAAKDGHPVTIIGPAVSKEMS